MAGIVLAQRALNLAVQPWDQVVQADIEVVQAILDFIDHGRANDPHLVALPQANNLLNDRALGIIILRYGKSSTIALHDIGDPAQLLQSRPPARLGWVGGKHRQNERAIEPALD